MRHPYGRCRDCGERLYEHIDGGYQCLNCQSRYPAAELEDGTEAPGFGDDTERPDSGKSE